MMRPSDAQSNAVADRYGTNAPRRRYRWRGGGVFGSATVFSEDRGGSDVNVGRRNEGHVRPGGATAEVCGAEEEEERRRRELHRVLGLVGVEPRIDSVLQREVVKTNVAWMAGVRRCVLTAIRMKYLHEVVGDPYHKAVDEEVERYAAEIGYHPRGVYCVCVDRVQHAFPLPTDGLPWLPAGSTTEAQIEAAMASLAAGV